MYQEVYKKERNNRKKTRLIYLSLLVVLLFWAANCLINYKNNTCNDDILLFKTKYEIFVKLNEN